jgi:hypothetical protein
MNLGQRSVFSQDRTTVRSFQRVLFLLRELLSANFHMIVMINDQCLRGWFEGSRRISDIFLFHFKSLGALMGFCGLKSS